MIKYRIVMLSTYRSDAQVEEEIIDNLKEINAELIIKPSPDEDRSIKYVKDADVILVDGNPVTEKVLNTAKKCKLVVQMAVGLDNIDIPAATRRGIYVANVPDYCVNEVSDHTLALVLALERKVNILDRNVRKGEWGLSENECIAALESQVYGLVGFGNIGRLVAQKAQVFGFNVVASDPFVSAEEAGKVGVGLVEFDRLLEISDVISIHVPLLKSTHHLFDEGTIGKMKNTAYLVNMSRGGTVDQKALYNALKSGRIAGAALDVMEKEPPEANEPLLSLDNIIITPHLAFYSDASAAELRKRAFEEALIVLEGGQPKVWVNRMEMTR